LNIIEIGNIIIFDNTRRPRRQGRPITNAKTDNLIHPIRLRILLAIASRPATSQQIAVYLPDVPQATLYRHIRALSEAGVLQVVEERPMRGATERVYAISPEKSQLSREELAALTPADNERMFSTFTAMLLSQFHNYVHQPEMDLLKDGVGYRTMPLYLSDSEFREMSQEINAILQKRIGNAASSGRRRRLLSVVIMPDVHSD